MTGRTPRTHVGVVTLMVIAMGFAFLVLLVSVPRVPAHADDDISISRVDLSGFPTGVIEFTAAAGRTGGTLSAADIELFENQVAKPFTFASVPTAGLEVVLLIDTSASMREANALVSAKSAAKAFLLALPPEVAVGLVTFGSSPTLQTPLTTDRTTLDASINVLTAHGETSLYDAIVFARTLFSGATNDRQFVLLGDGGDTVSKHSLADALAVSTEIRTNVIELVSSEANHDALAQLSAADNGTFTSAADPAALAGAYLLVANTLVNRYQLTFQTSVTGDAQYSVRVRTVGGPIDLTATGATPTTITPTTITPTTSPPTTSSTGGSTVGATASGPSTAVTTPVGSSNGEGSSTLLRSLGALAIFAMFATLGLIVLPTATRDYEVAPLGPQQPDPLVADRGRRSRLGSAIDRLLERRGRRRGIADALETAAISLRPGEFIVMVLVVTLLVAAALYLVAGAIACVVGMALAPLLARTYVRTRAHRRQRAFAEQLPDVLQMLVTSLRGGFGLMQALDSIASQSAEPARSEFDRVLFEIRIGSDPADALAAAAARMHSRDFDWMVSAMQINREIGGELAIILENLAETVRDRQKMQRQVQSLTAEGRISAYILTALPIFLVAAMTLMNPGYFAPMSRSPGPLLILIAIVMLAMGWGWMRKIIKTRL